MYKYKTVISENVQKTADEVWNKMRQWIFALIVERVKYLVRLDESTLRFYIETTTLSITDKEK